MEVVDHEHERLNLAGRPQERGGGVEQPEARALGVERGSRGQVGEELVELGQHLGDVGRARPELGANRAPGPLSRM